MKTIILVIALIFILSACELELPQPPEVNINQQIHFER